MEDLFERHGDAFNMNMGPMGGWALAVHTPEHMNECLVNQAKYMIPKWPGDLPTSSARASSMSGLPDARLFLFHGCAQSRLLPCPLPRVWSVALLARRFLDSLLIHMPSKLLEFYPICGAYHLCMKHIVACAAGVESLALPLGRSSTNEETRPWRVAIGEVLSQRTIAKLELPLMASEYSAAIKKYARNPFLLKLFRQL